MCSYVKHTVRRLVLLLLVAAYSLCLGYVPARADVLPSGTAEGYFVTVDIQTLCSVSDDGTDEEAPELPGLTHIIDDIYFAEDATATWQAIDQYDASVLEPNYTAELFEGTDATTPYAMVNAGYAARYDLTGQGVRVAIIDSGLDTGNINLQGAHIVDGYNYIAKTYTISDDVYHGSNVAQLIVGRGVAGGVYGIARDAEIFVLDCFSSSQGGTVSTLCRAIRDAVDTYHCDIINMSWGVTSSTSADNLTALHTVLQYAAERGVLLIAAAGNVTSRMPQGTVVYPAAFDEVIGVGSLDNNYNPLSSSQQTPAVYVSAPGTCSCFMTSTRQLRSGSGTSYACPCVTAVAAMLRQLCGPIAQEDLKALFQSRSVGNDGVWQKSNGYGYLQLDALLSTPWVGSAIDSEAISVYGWQLESSGSQLLCFYDPAGRMTDVYTVSHDTGSFHLVTDMQTNRSKLRVFSLSDAYVPLCAAYTRYLQD